MEKRVILAIALSIGVLWAWTKLFPPPERPPQPVTTEPAITEQLPDARGEVRGPVALPEEDEAEAEPELAEAKAAEGVEELLVTTDLYEVRLTNRGAGVLSWKLREFNSNGQLLELFPQFETQEMLPLFVDLENLMLAAELNQALYQVERGSVTPAGERIAFHWSDGRGLEARKTLIFREGSYLVDVELDVIDRGRRVDARLSLGPGFGAQELAKGRSNYYYDAQALWHIGGQVTRTKKKKLDEAGGFTAATRWAGLEDQYFTALVLPGSGRAFVGWRQQELTRLPLAGTEADEDPPEASAEPLLYVSLPEGQGQLYVGPKQYKPMKLLGHQLEESVWFSSQPWLAVIVKQIYLGLLWIHDNVVGNYGMAIILATFILRLALFPLNQYAMVKMKKSQLQMARIQPKVKALRAKYKKSKDAQSRAKMNQEQMELYKREGVNPMGGVTGCLPMLAQFPILIGFYNMLTVAIELRQAPFFGWIQDLTVKDPYMITPLLMGVTMFAQQKMAMTKIKDPQQMQQQKIMMFMPFMFTFICLQMPAGLVLYWFMNNVLGIGQQYLVNKHTMKAEAAQKHQKKVKVKP